MNENLKTIYIAGKITGVEFLNMPAFYNAENKLRILGYGRVINPHAICMTIPLDSEWYKYMRRCLKAVADSDVVAVLPDWKNSRGAVVEVLIAMLLNIPVLSIDTMNPVKKRMLWFHIVKFIILHPFAYINKN